MARRGAPRKASGDRTSRPTSSRNPRTGDRRGAPSSIPSGRDGEFQRNIGRASRAGWGGVARRGAGALSDRDEPQTTQHIGREIVARRERDAPTPSSRREPQARFAIRTSGAKPSSASRGIAPASRGTAPTSRVAAPETSPLRHKRKREVPFDVSSELRQAAAPRDVARVELRLADAARAYDRERYTDALPTLRDLAKVAPGASSVRELLGLTYYRLGRWRDAIRELRAFFELTGSVDQHPVLADCERALGNHSAVTDLFAELRQAGAGSDVLAEGRLVMAGSLADRGRVDDAIELLLPAVTRPVRKPLDRHLRQWYAIADLYERSGDLPRAREYFLKVVAADPEMSDVVERLASLR